MIIPRDIFYEVYTFVTTPHRGMKTAFLPVRGVPYEPGVYLQSQQKHAILGHGGKVTQMSFRDVPGSRHGGDGSD